MLAQVITPPVPWQTFDATELAAIQPAFPISKRLLRRVRRPALAEGTFWAITRQAGCWSWRAHSSIQSYSAGLAR